MLSLIHDIRLLNPHSCQDMTSDLQASNLTDPYQVTIQVGKAEFEYMKEEEARRARENSSGSEEEEDEEAGEAETVSNSAGIESRRKKRAVPINTGGISITMKVIMLE